MAFPKTIERKNAHYKPKTKKKANNGAGISPPTTKSLHNNTVHTSPLPPLSHLPPDVLASPTRYLVLTYHAAKNITPPQQERQTRDKNEEEEVFFPLQKSQTTELFGSICYKTKIRHNNMISEINVTLT
jgi:hypothetical protein